MVFFKNIKNILKETNKNINIALQRTEKTKDF